MELHATHLLSLARPGPDKPENIDLNALINSTVEMLQTAGRIRHTSVMTQVPNDVISVHANRTRLEQVLVNLIVNAADAIATGGTDNYITIELTHHDGNAVVRVKDTGCGIPSDLVDSIFEPYVSTKSADSGTGLGLSVVRRIMQKLGGRVWIEKTDSSGSVFAFELRKVEH